MPIEIKGKARFKLRSGTLNEWMTENPVLLSGEPGVVADGTESEWLKIGDGATRWKDLPWKRGPKGAIGPRGKDSNILLSGAEWIFNGGNANSTVKINGMDAIGSIWVGGKNSEGNIINPTDLFGGVWELFDKEFASRTLGESDSGDLFEKDANINNYNIAVVYAGHTIRLRLGFAPVIDFSVGDFETAESVEFHVGNLIFKNIGLSGLGYGINGIPAMSDPSNGVVIATIEYNGNVIINQVLHNTSAQNSNGTYNLIYINKEITVPKKYMLDEFCDKFYWKRIG